MTSSADEPAPYPHDMSAGVLDDYAGLPLAVQYDLDDAINALEWDPLPDDVMSMRGGAVLAVKRCGVWVVYEVRDDPHGLSIVSLEPEN